MNTTALSPRARILGTFAAAGVTALIGTLAVASSASAGSEAPRITVSLDPFCNDDQPVGIDLHYDDHVDGHRPTAVHEELSDGTQVVWTRDELHQQNGDFFNTAFYPEGGNESQWIDSSRTYTYSVTMTYDDGVTQTQAASVALSTACPDGPPSTTTPPTSEADRFGLQQNGFFCGERGERAFVVWHYQDYADGHYAARADLQVLKNGVLIDQLEVQNPDPSSDGAETAFQIPEGNLSDAPLEVASYSLAMTVTYEDGATDKHIETFDLKDLCNGVVNGRTATPPSTTPPSTTAPGGASTTTTTVPGGTLPATGSSDLTWVIGAVAGLLTTAGAALFAGVRRSRND